MSYFVVDVEADGPIPYRYSMVCFGAVLVEPGLGRQYYARTRPISEHWQPEALAVSGFSRDEHAQFDDPQSVMQHFGQWVTEHTVGRPVFVSDNVAFDWQWINWYFHYYLGHNPFGHSGRRIGDLYCGMLHDAGLNQQWKKKLRKTPHDHHPLNDALGNAQALLAMQDMGLRL